MRIQVLILHPVQSVCFEELPPTHPQPDNVDANVKEQHVEDDLQSAEEQEHDPDIVETQPAVSIGNETSAALEAQPGFLGKSSHGTDALTKKQTEPVVAAKDDPVYRLLQSASGQDQGPKADESVLPPFQLDCWSVASCVLAAQYNHTIDVEQFCPTSGSSLNVSYVVPVSRYLQASSLELHLRLVGYTLFHYSVTNVFEFGKILKYLKDTNAVCVYIQNHTALEPIQSSIDS